MDIKELIFEAYKDKSLLAKKFKAEIAKDYKITGDEARDLFVRINNYQIKKHGRRLFTEDIDIYTKQEILRVNSNARKRRGYNKKGRVKNGG